MIVTWRAPVGEIRGTLGPDVYARVVRGKCIIQRRPDRSRHVPSEAELKNRKKFAQKYAGSHRTVTQP